jgi:hypothetical protein
MRRIVARTPSERSGHVDAWRPSGHSRRAWVVVIVASFGCTTTHALGRIGDPATLVALRQATAHPGAFARVEPLGGGRPPAVGAPVRALTGDGLLVGDASGAQTLAPLARVRSVSTYDRLRGARDGAVVLGVVTFVLVGTAAALLASRSSTDGCGDCQSHAEPSPALVFFGAGGLFGLAGALLGGGLGALGGHEDRYVVAPR